MAGLGSGCVCVEGIKGLEGFSDTRGRRPLPRPAGGFSIGLVESDGHYRQLPASPAAASE